MRPFTTCSRRSIVPCSRPTSLCSVGLSLRWLVAAEACAPRVDASAGCEEVWFLDDDDDDDDDVRHERRRVLDRWRRRCYVHVPATPTPRAHASRRCPPPPPQQPPASTRTTRLATSSVVDRPRLIVSRRAWREICRRRRRCLLLLLLRGRQGEGGQRQGQRGDVQCRFSFDDDEEHKKK